MKNVFSIYGFQIISWIIANNIFGIPIYFMMRNVPDNCLEQNISMGFWESTLTNVLSAIFIGTLLGSIDLLLLKFFHKKRAFRQMFVHKVLFYLGTIIFMILTIGLTIQLTYHGLSFFDSLDKLNTELNINIMIAYLIYISSTCIIISFINQIRQMFGKGILLPLFLGKYYSPRVEERVFMFLDLQSSTSIAEKLGHISYSSFIQDCFYDLNQVTPKFDANIYQYVGDEAVLTWKSGEGIKANNCINVFFAFQDILEQKQSYYQKQYGLTPTFKAGMNMGEVTVTEVGDIKKEIAYHGDVLNTAARIQGICNQYKKDILISEFLEKKLGWNNGIKRELVGELSLKGKTEKVKVFSIG